MTYKVILKSKKDEPVRRYHPWIFRGAIKAIEGDPADGDWVKVYANKGAYLAAGHYQTEGSIAVRLFTWSNEKPCFDFWYERIRKAYTLRESVGLTKRSDINAYRLVYAEADNMPGLIIDHYNGHFVIQCHSMGVAKNIYLISDALKKLYGRSLVAIYDKSENTLYHENVINQHLHGNAQKTIINENSIEFTVDWVHGQKTGFFLDQRDNRALLRSLSKDKRVLNTFSYSGGFTLAALKGVASVVHSVDSSAKAIELLRENLTLNGFDTDENRCYISDTLEFLKNLEDSYDIIVLDPPAYAKHISARHNAVQGYKRLNSTAMKNVKNGGMLLTFSCSQVIDRKLFESTIMAASLVADKNVKIVGRLSQSIDHPVSIYHTEGEYLKGLLLIVSDFD